MKNKIIQFVLVFETLFLLSCDRAENTDEFYGLPYYEFTPAKRTNLLTAPMVGDQITNQDGEIISFKVKVAENGKKVTEQVTFQAVLGGNTFITISTKFQCGMSMEITYLKVISKFINIR